MIEIKSLKKQFGNKHILNGVDLKIERGKTTVILGISGGGKSTIIKHIVGLLKPNSGQIIYNNQDIVRLDEKGLMKIRKEVGYLFQSGALFDSMNVFDNIAFPLKEHQQFLSKKEIKNKVLEKIKMVGLKANEVINLFPSELSGGMKKRVGLARTIILEPKVILYDEPTSGLDPITSDLITQMMLNLQRELNTTSILISHDMKESFKVGDYFAMLIDGKIISYGDKEYFKNTDNPYVIQFLNGNSDGIIKII